MMAYGKLGPKLEAKARGQGDEAAREKRAGRVPPRCPYRSDAAAPLTERRMAAVWLDAFMSGTGFE